MKNSKFITIVTMAALLGFGLATVAQIDPGGPEDADTTAAEKTPAEKTDTAKTDNLSLAQVIEKLQSNYQEINTYSAEFEQEIYSTAQGRVMTRGKGTASYKKPGKMVWRYREPEEHIYVTDGDTIWDYSPAEKEAYVLSVKDALYKSFLLGLGQIKKDFEVSFHAGRSKDKQGFYQLDLVPRNRAEREAIGTITIYVDGSDFLVRKTQMMDALGNRNRIRFKDMKINPEIPDSLFKFEPPPGVKVIEARDIVPGKDK